MLQVSLRHPLALVVANARRHLLSADLGQVSAHDPVVESIEHAHQTHIHPCGGLHPEYDVETEECGHHGDVAKDANNVADLVD